MESYRILLFLHIAASVVVFGATFSFPFLQGFAERRGVTATRFMLEFTRRLDNILITPGALIVAVFGIGLIFDDETGFKDDFPGWLMGAVLWFVVMFAVMVTVQRRTVGDALKALDGAQDEGSLPVGYVALGKRLQMVGGLLGLSVLGILALMVWGAEGGFN